MVMNDKEPTPVSGGDGRQGTPDGVNQSDARTAGGESGGGGYDNPHTGKDGDSDASGFLGHGGQTEIGYHGGGQASSQGIATQNATAEGDSDAEHDSERGPKPGPTGPDQDFSAEYPREIQVDGRRLEIVDTSGVAAAEAAGTIGRDGDANASNAPGSG